MISVVVPGPIKAVKTDLDQLLRWNLPAILHVNESHFVAFLGLDGDRLVIFDSSMGLLDCTLGWFRERYQWNERIALNHVGDTTGTNMASLSPEWSDDEWTMLCDNAFLGDDGPTH